MWSFITQPINTCDFSHGRFGFVDFAGVEYTKSEPVSEFGFADSGGA